MGKWLTIEEKLNAEKELEENRLIMKWLREQLNAFKYRNGKLTNYLENRNRSKYDGLFGIDGYCYKMFGKKFSELTVEEKRQYRNYRKAESRKKLERE